MWYTDRRHPHTVAIENDSNLNLMNPYMQPLRDFSFETTCSHFNIL